MISSDPITFSVLVLFVWFFFYYLFASFFIHVVSICFFFSFSCNDDGVSRRKSTKHEGIEI